MLKGLFACHAFGWAFQVQLVELLKRWSGQDFVIYRSEGCAFDFDSAWSEEEDSEGGGVCEAGAVGPFRGADFGQPGAELFEQHERGGL